MPRRSRMPVPKRQRSLGAALGVGPAGVYAFVGAGGKTSAIRRLLLERPDALATTTTHLGDSGYGVGMLVASPDVRRLEALLRQAAGVRPLTVARSGAGLRLAAPPLGWMHAYCVRHRLELVLVEADGARRRRLKLPAAHEPAWPPAALAGAVLVVGAGALGAPVAVACHRPAAFAAAGRGEARVTIRHLELMLAGYLARLPPTVPVAVLFTGLGPHERVLLRRLADCVLRHVRGRDVRWGDPQVPVRIVATPDVTGGPYWSIASSRSRASRGVRVPRVCGVLLAAGTGTRFGPGAPGGSKLLLRWRRRSLVARAARAWEAAGFAHQIVVTGHAREAVEAELDRAWPGGRRRSRVVVRNAHPARGLGRSVRLAARRAPEGMGLLFGHADMPRVSAATLRTIATLGVTLRDWIVVPTVRGRPVHPIYFPASLRPELARLPDRSGGRLVIAAHRDRVLQVPQDERAGEFLDVDRPAGLRRLG